MTVELTSEQAAAIFWLAGSELQVMKADWEELGQEPDMAEIGVLLELANLTNPSPEQGVLTWEAIPAAPPEDEEDSPLTLG